MSKRPERSSHPPESPASNEGHLNRSLLYAYVTAVFGASVFMLAQADWTLPADSAAVSRWFFAFVALGTLVEAGFSRLRVSSATTSVAFIPYLASVLLVGPAWSMVVAGFTELVAETLIRRKPLMKVLHNTSKEIVSIGVGAYAYVGLGGTPSFNEFSIHIVGFVAAVATYFTLSQGTVVVAIALSTNTNLWHWWKQLAGGSLFYDFTSGPVAILLALVFVRMGWIGILVVMIPLFFVRHVYDMNIRLEEVNRELRESEEASRRVVEASPVAIVVHGKGRIIYANPAAVTLLGAPNPSQLIGMGAADFVHTDGLSDPQQWVTPRSDGEPEIRERKLRRLDGQIIDVEAAEIPFGYRGQAATQLILRDITDRKRAEEERRSLESKMRQAQKLESLGVLAGGIAHDFNNLLVGVLGNASLVLEALRSGSTERSMVEQIEKAALRASELTNQMLAYSGKGKFVIERTDLNELVSEMSHLLEAAISKKATLEFEFAKGLPAVEVDATQIRQVVMNLITNASDALERQGKVRIRTGVLQVDDDTLRDAYLPDRLENGEYIFLAVSDTGCGMDAETRSRIFDPFFTTKFTGRGLGLASVLGIVRSHRGTIKLDTTPGVGTTFTVLLPVTPDQDERREATPVALPEAGEERGVVLVVDDEEAVRMVAQRMLEKFGYKVITARDGRDGVEKFRQHKSEIVAVLLDLAMPRMNGEEAFDAMQEIDPAPPVLLMSGFAEEDVVDRFMGRGVRGFLKKPFPAATLRGKMQDALRAQSPQVQ